MGSYAAIAEAVPRYSPFAAYHPGKGAAEPCPTDSGDGRISRQSTGCTVAQLPPLCGPVYSGSEWYSHRGEACGGSRAGSGLSNFTSQDPYPFARTSVTSVLRVPDRSTTGIMFAMEVRAVPVSPSSMHAGCCLHALCIA